MTADEVLIDLIRRFGKYEENPKDLVEDSRTKIKSLLDENFEAKEKSWYIELEKAETYLDNLDENLLVSNLKEVQRQIVISLRELKFPAIKKVEA